MQLIPGLREPRNAFTAGIVWVAAAWVFAVSRSWSGNLAVFGGQVASLSDWAGVLATFGALAVVAFIVGTAARSLSHPISWIIRRETVVRELRSQVNDRCNRSAISDVDRATILRAYEQDAKAEAARVEITLLQEDDAPYERLDRLGHEADFRVELVFPLAVLAGVVTFTVAAWGLLLLVVVAGVAWQAWTRHRVWARAVAGRPELVPAIPAALAVVGHLWGPDRRLSDNGRSVLSGEFQVVDPPALVREH